jgi:DNA modification methylase
MRSPAELIAYARNPRKHPEKQIVKLMASMRRYGFTQPVLLTAAGEIIAGHARVEAAKRLQLVDVPTLCLDHLSPAQVREYRLADNQLGALGEWDMELLTDELRAIIEIDEISCIEAMGWDIPEVEIMIDASPAPAPDKADPADEQLPLSENFVPQLGDLWLLGKHRLLCGSSLEAENWTRLMHGEKAVMSFVDPPYNIKVDGFVCGSGKIKHDEFQMASGEMSEAEFIDFLATFLERMTAHMVDGSITAAAMDFRHMYELQTAARGVGLSLLNMCVWNKSNGGMGSLYRSKHELIFIFKKGRAPHINNVMLGVHGRYRANVWDFPGINSFGKGRMEDLESHPTVKPVALVAECIRDISHPGQVVTDAFLGSGTTLLAAERTGRRCFGVEIEPKYVDLAIRRWEKLTGLSAIRESDGRSYAELVAEAAGTSQQAA